MESESESEQVLGWSGFDRVIWARGTPINMVRVRQTLARLYEEREREQRRIQEEKEREERKRVRENDSMWVQDQSLVVIDGDGIRVVSNARPILRNETNGVLGVFMDDIIIESGMNKEIERENIQEEEDKLDMRGEEDENVVEDGECGLEGAVGGLELECVRDDDRDMRGGGGEGENRGKEIFPTPIEIIDVSGNLCHIYDAENLEFNGISVDGFAREPEDVTQARMRRISTSAGLVQSVEDDNEAAIDLPSGGH